MKISAGLRMYVQPCLSVIVCVAVAVVGLRGLANVARTVDDMSITSTALRNHMEGDMMHDALRADVLAAMLAATDEDKQQVLSDIKDHSENFRASLKANTQLNLNAEVKAAIMETETKLGEYIKGAEEMVALALKNREDAKGRLPAFLTLFGELEELESAASEKVEASAKAAVETEERTVAGTQTTMFVGGGLAVLVLVVCAVLTIRSIVVPLRSCLSVLTSCAGGDLTKRTSWKGGDEFGVLAASTNTLAENFGKIIRAVQGSATEVASAATQIASSANEMSAAVDDVAKQTTRTSESASESGRIAREGGEVVRHTVDGMQQINNAVSASAASVTKLGNRGREIGEIIGVINDIADQTNLLALNAAIEAARAGEHGRGFAVVADEVRKLAERTTRATEEVGQSIQAIQKETEEAVRRMHAGTEQVKVGVQLATQAGESLDQIVTGATDVAGMVQSISAAAEEAGAGARQSADAAVQLSQKAEQLQQMVSQFTIDQK